MSYHRMLFNSNYNFVECNPFFFSFPFWIPGMFKAIISLHKPPVPPLGYMSGALISDLETDVPDDDADDEEEALEIPRQPYER